MFLNYLKKPTKLLIQIISFIFLLQMTAPAQTTYTWNGNIANWNTSTEWIPNGIPSAGDSAVINSGKVIISAATDIGYLNLNYGGIDCGNKLQIFNSFSWTGGYFENGGDTVLVHSTATFNLSGSNSKSLGCVLINETTCTWSEGQFILDDNISRFINNSVFDIQLDQHMGNSGRIINNGILKKTAGSGITSFGSSFYNHDSVDIQIGTLKPTGYVTGSGSYNIAEGAVFLSAGAHKFNGNILSGEGIFEVQSAYTSGTTIAGAGLIFPSSLTFKFTNGFIKGDGPIEINGPFTCSGTFETGADTVWVRHMSTFNGVRLRRVLVNEDTCTWSGFAVSLDHNNSRFINNSVLDIQNDQHSGNSGKIINNGLLKKTAGSGTTSFSNTFVNNGLVEIHSGKINFRGPTKNSLTGIISGIGTIGKTSEGSFTNHGSFSPGLSPGLLTYTGNFPMSVTAAYNVELGGNEAITQYDRMDISGTAALNGELNIALIDGFIPAMNDTFRILNYANRSGEFATINCPDSLIVDILYETNGVIIIVIDINNPPEKFSLIQPIDGDTLSSIGEIVQFLWQASVDDSSDTLTYTFRLFGSQSDTTISDLTDTSLVFDGSSFLKPVTKYEWTVLVNDEYTTVYSDTFYFFTPEITDIKEITELELPKSFSLKQNYPNPFNPATAINYLLPISSNVELSIYNMLGQKVKTLVSKKQTPGNYTINWDASGLSSGVYIYLLKSDDKIIASKKMILLR